MFWGSYSKDVELLLEDVSIKEGCTAKSVIVMDDGADLTR